MVTSRQIFTGAALSFSLGSFFLIVELTIALIVRKEDLTSGILLPTGWTLIGVLGIVGWLLGGGLLLSLRFLGTSESRSDRHNIFLAGRGSFRCRSCKRTIDATKVGYHERMVCECGMAYNVFQDMDEDRDGR